MTKFKAAKSESSPKVVNVPFTWDELFHLVQAMHLYNKRGEWVSDPELRERLETKLNKARVDAHDSSVGERILAGQAVNA